MAVAEISSAIAVVLSLLFVGFEIRRTTVESDADIQAELLSYTHQRRYLVIENGELSDLVAKGYADPGALTASERLRFQKYIELHFVAWERAFDTNHAGLFADEHFVLWAASDRKRRWISFPADAPNRFTEKPFYT